MAWVSLAQAETKSRARQRMPSLADAPKKDEPMMPGAGGMGGMGGMDF